MKIIIILLLLLGFTYFIYQDGHFRVNNERAGFFLLRGGYRAYWIRYGEGLQYLSDRRYKNLWCFPRFEHCDIRTLIRGGSK